MCRGYGMFCVFPSIFTCVDGFNWITRQKCDVKMHCTASVERRKHTMYNYAVERMAVKSIQIRMFMQICCSV